MPPGRPQTGWMALPPMIDTSSLLSARMLDDLPADLEADLADDAEDVALGGVEVGAHDEVGTGEHEEMGRVVAGEEAVVEQLTQLATRGRGLHAEDPVEGFGGGYVVRLRADAADARRDARQLLDRPADAEALEAAQLGDLEVGVGHFAVVVQENLDLAVALETGDWIDADLFHVQTLALLQQRSGETEAIERAHRVGDGRGDLGDLLRCGSRRRWTRAC